MTWCSENAALSSWVRFLCRSCQNLHSYTEPYRFSALSWYLGDPRQQSPCLRQVRRCMICEADPDELSHGLASTEPACCMVVVQREHNGQRTSNVYLWLLRSSEEGLDTTPRWSYAVGSRRALRSSLVYAPSNLRVCSLVSLQVSDPYMRVGITVAWNRRILVFLVKCAFHTLFRRVIA